MIESIAVLLVLLVAKGFFSGSEIALVHADKARLRHRAATGHNGAKLAAKMFERPEILLATTLIGTNISTVVITALGTGLMIRHFGNNGDAIAFAVLTPFLLVFGEIVPKSIYQQKCDTLAPIIVYPLRAFGLVFAPIVFIFSRTARMAAWIIGHGTPGANLFAVREQLRAVIETSGSEAGPDIFDKDRIANVIRFGELTVGEVMVPAAETIEIDSGYTTADAMSLVRRTGYTHFPVFDGKRSNVIGLLSLRIWDLLQPDLADRELAELVRPALYVSPQQPLTELLPTLRARDDQSAVVVDEYGSAVGLITADRILETIVGGLELGAAFEERSSTAPPGYTAVDTDSYEVDGRLPVAQLNELLGSSFDTRPAFTVGGLMIDRLRHIPRASETIVDGGYRLTVLSASDRAVNRVRLDPA